jgi:thymidylate synthase
VYGHQWRNFGATKPKYTPIGKPGEPNDYNSIDYEDNGVDQLANVIERIKTNPDCRRLIVTGWNPQEINDVKLPPCHTLFQFYVFNGKLSCQLYQRSADFFLGVPFNIASYALLTHLVAHVTGLKVGEFVHTFGDAHIYNNHIEQMQEQISRELLPMPKLLLSPGITCIDDFKFGDIVLEGYESHPAIKGEVSV